MLLSARHISNPNLETAFLLCFFTTTTTMTPRKLYVTTFADRTRRFDEPVSQTVSYTLFTLSRSFSGHECIATGRHTSKSGRTDERSDPQTFFDGRFGKGFPKSFSFSSQLFGVFPLLSPTRIFTGCYITSMLVGTLLSLDLMEVCNRRKDLHPVARFRARSFSIIVLRCYGTNLLHRSLILLILHDIGTEARYNDKSSTQIY